MTSKTSEGKVKAGFVKRVRALTNIKAVLGRDSLLSICLFVYLSVNLFMFVCAFVGLLVC